MSGNIFERKGVNNRWPNLPYVEKFDEERISSYSLPTIEPIGKKPLFITKPKINVEIEINKDFKILAKLSFINFRDFHTLCGLNENAPC